MIRYAAAYAAALAAFAALDMAWLSFAAGRFYRPILGDLLAAKVALAPAAAFYLLYTAGVVVLASAPALKDGGWTRAAASGAVLGLVAYGTYDLTNQATLRTWATRLTLMDMGWGAVATAVSALAAFFVAHALVTDRA